MDYAFDLHMHSCLSPCGADEMTPATIAGLCKLAGLDIAALTDHNTAGNCGAFCRACAHYGVLGLAGMELCTAEEVHVICLFPTVLAAEQFSDLVRTHLSGMENDVAIFGAQQYRDENDLLLGEESLMLAGASSLGVYEVAPLAEQFGGVALPAHMDRPSFSISSNLGLWDESFGFPVVEVSPQCTDAFFAQHPDFAALPRIRGCDAHYIAQITDAAQTMSLASLDAEAVIAWLRRGAPKQ